MSIESTKKIIVTIIIAIIILAIATPTYAATKNSINFGSAFKVLTSFAETAKDFAKKTTKAITPAIGEFTNKVSNIDTKSITGILNEAKTKIAENNKLQTIKNLVNSGENLVLNKGKEILEGVNEIKLPIDRDKNVKTGLLQVVAKMGNGLERISNKITGIFNIENDKTKISEVIGRIGSFLGNRNKLDILNNNQNEPSIFAQKANEIKTYISNNNYKYQYTHSENPYSTENRKINCSQYVSWVIYEYAKESGNILLENMFKESRGSKQIYAYMVANPLQFQAKGNLSQIDPSQLQEGDIIVKKVDILEEVGEELGVIEESDGGHIEIYAGYNENSNSPYVVYNAGSDSCLGYVKSTGQCNGNLEDYEVFRMR